VIVRSRRGGNTALLRAGLVDEISVVIVPYLGGQSGRAAAACRQGRYRRSARARPGRDGADARRAHLAAVCRARHQRIRRGITTQVRCMAGPASAAGSARRGWKSPSLVAGIAKRHVTLCALLRSSRDLKRMAGVPAGWIPGAGLHRGHRGAAERGDAGHCDGPACQLGGELAG